MSLFMILLMKFFHYSPWDGDNMVSKKGLNILDTIGKLIFQKIAKAENDAFTSYSSPLQRRSPSK